MWPFKWVFVGLNPSSPTSAIYFNPEYGKPEEVHINSIYSEKRFFKSELEALDWAEQNLLDLLNQVRSQKSIVSQNQSNHENFKGS